MKSLNVNKFLFIILFFSQNITTEEKLKLSHYAHNTYSQFGEDGVVAKIFEIIGTTSKICLEVGGGDGPGGSNIAHLWKDLGWRGVLIEADPHRLKTLEPSIQGYNNCTLVKSYIEKDENLGTTIDSIVTNLGITERLDLLSLDIDGNDYYIFENLKIHPRVMIIEFNHTIPYYRDVYQNYSNHSWQIGSSVAALKRMGKQKGYELVALTDVNALFVDAQYFDKFKDYEMSLEKMFNTSYLKNIIHSFGGDPILVGKINGLSDGFFKVGYPESMNCENCYVLRVNEIDINDEDLNKNFPGFSKNKK